MSDIETLIAQFTEAREKLVSERQSYVEKLATIDQQLAKIGMAVPGAMPKRRGRPPKMPGEVAATPVEGVTPKRRGRPPKVPSAVTIPVGPTAVAKGNGHIKPDGKAPQSPSEFIKWILTKAPGIPVDSIAVAASENLDKPMSRAALHNTLFYMRKNGTIMKKGQRSEATYWLKSKGG